MLPWKLIQVVSHFNMCEFPFVLIGFIHWDVSSLLSSQVWQTSDHSFIEDTRSEPVQETCDIYSEWWVTTCHYIFVANAVSDKAEEWGILLPNFYHLKRTLVTYVISFSGGDTKKILCNHNHVFSLQGDYRHYILQGLESEKTKWSRLAW